MKIRQVNLLMAVLAVAGTLAAAGYFYLRGRLLAIGTSPRDLAPTKPEWPAPAVIAPEAWSVFRGSGGGAPLRATSGPASSRFRLAGTFFILDASENPSVRKAILDDLKSGEQRVLGEGEAIEEYQVMRVAEDVVTIRSPAGDTDLRLSFLDIASSIPTEAARAVASTNDATGQPEVFLEQNQFGGRVGYNRWVFKRSALMNYYHEILDDPERIAALYVSLKPDYQQNEIAGYHLDPEGENAFFAAMGLQKGDVIRKVNSMNMTSQKRAEYFIGEFVKNRLNAFVLDVEREGKPEKMIYLLR